jgi:hypothetical protein
MNLELDAILKLMQDKAKVEADDPDWSGWVRLGGLRHVYYPDSKTCRWFDETGPITKVQARMWLRRRLYLREPQP